MTHSSSQAPSLAQFGHHRGLPQLSSSSKKNETGSIMYLEAAPIVLDVIAYHRIAVARAMLF
jgi:hypothetical protein